MRVGQICLDCESEISGIMLMVDLRVVDISGFDVILDIDELTTHRVVSDCDLRRVIIPTRSWCCIRLHMNVSDAYVCGISGQNFFKGGRV